MREIDSAHRKILKKFSGGQKMEKIASKLGVISFNPNKIIFSGKFMRGIDCKHFQHTKALLRTRKSNVLS